MEEVSEKVEQVKLSSTTEASLFAPGFLIAGKFEIIEKLGEGGMATVYRARQHNLGRDVAIKVLHEHLEKDVVTARRFDKEAKAVAALKHHNLVGVVDNGVVDGHSYLVMDYIQGTRLTELIAREQITWEQFKQLASQLCAGLAHAHHHGLVHRDLKPSNIMLTSENGVQTAKIVDFGIVKTTTEDLSDPVTQTGEIFGTTYYMSPEQCQGFPVDHRSDIYSLGCVFFQMLTGEMPFVGASPIATVMKHLNDDVPKLGRDDIPPHMQKVIDRAMAKDPADRFQTVDELLAAINDPTNVGQWKIRRQKKNHWSIVGAVIVGLAVILSGGYFLSNQAPLDPKAHANVLLNQATEALKRGQFEEALALSDKSLLLDPNATNSVMLKAQAFFHQNKMDQALANVNRAIELDPADPEKYRFRGDVYINRREYNKALADFSKALRLNPKFAPALLARGKMLHQLGKDSDALQDFQEYLNYNPDDVVALTDRAGSRQALKDYDAAMQDLSRALEVSPDYVPAYVTRSALYSEMGQLKKAYMDSLKATQLSPENYVAYNNLGYISYQLKDYATARLNLDKMLELNPNFAEGYASRGDVRFDTGDVKGSIEDFETALKLDPQNVSALTGLDFAKKHPKGGKMPQNRASVRAELAPE